MTTSDYTNWKEGIGDSVKPPDFDANPDKYEVKFNDFNDNWWRSEFPFQNATQTYRVRLRETKHQTNFLRVADDGPCDTKMQDENESDFLRRMLCLAILRVDLNVTPEGANGGSFTVRGAVALTTAETLRLARLVAKSTP